MIDSVSLEKLNSLHPKLRDRAIIAYNEAVKQTPANVHPRITETLRTFERSNELFNQPFDHKDNDQDGKIDESDEKVTNAKAGQSYHNYGLALDFVLLIDGKVSWKVDNNWMTVVDIFKKHGFESGLTFSSPDAPHLEDRFGYNWRTLLEKYNNKDFISGSSYINI